MSDGDAREACGVFGVFAPGKAVAHLTYLGLYALQHRGQESAGMAVADGTTLTVVKDMGLVPNVFDDRTLILETMRYPDEIRPTTALAGLQEQVAVEEAELELAIHLIQRLAGPFEPQRYQDQYRLALQERIEARIQGRDVTRAPAGGPVSPPVADLLAALRASLENGAQAAGAAQQLQPTPPP